jgi:hypothetical protein
MFAYRLLLWLLLVIILVSKGFNKRNGMTNRKDNFFFGKIYGKLFKKNAPKIIKNLPVEQWNWKPAIPELADLEISKLPQWNKSIETNYKPTEKVQKVVLVFEQGFYTELLIQRLHQSGLKYFALDYSQLLGMESLQIEVGVENAKKCIKIKNLILNFEDVAAVLWCTPAECSFLIPEDHLKTNEYMVTERWRMLLRDLRFLLPENVIWMPSFPLNGSNEWQNKFSELELALRCGLNVPPTLCTDNKKLLSYAKKNIMTTTALMPAKN